MVGGEWNIKVVPPVINGLSSLYSFWLVVVVWNINFIFPYIGLVVGVWTLKGYKGWIRWSLVSDFENHGLVGGLVFEFSH